MKREPIFPTRIGKRSLAEGKLCLIRERNEEQRKAVQELAEPFKDLLVPVDDTDWDLALVGYELEKDKWINLERLFVVQLGQCIHHVQRVALARKSSSSLTSQVQQESVTYN